jgi:hypothetical protein
MDITTVLRQRHARIRRAFARAALPGPRRAGEFRRLVRMPAMPVFGPADRICDLLARVRGSHRRP